MKLVLESRKSNNEYIQFEYLIRVERITVGNIIFRKYLNDKSNYLEYIYIEEDYRKNGYAKQALLALFKKQKINPNLRLTVTQKSIKFWQCILGIQIKDLNLIYKVYLKNLEI